MLCLNWQTSIGSLEFKVRSYSFVNWILLKYSCAIQLQSAFVVCLAILGAVHLESTNILSFLDKSAYLKINDTSTNQSAFTGQNLSHPILNVKSRPDYPFSKPIMIFQTLDPSVQTISLKVSPAMRCSVKHLEISEISREFFQQLLR